MGEAKNIYFTCLNDDLGMRGSFSAIDFPLALLASIENIPMPY